MERCQSIQYFRKGSHGEPLCNRCGLTRIRLEKKKRRIESTQNANIESENGSLHQIREMRTTARPSQSLVNFAEVLRNELPSERGVQSRDTSTGGMEMSPEEYHTSWSRSELQDTRSEENEKNDSEPNECIAPDVDPCNIPIEDILPSETSEQEYVLALVKSLLDYNDT